MIIMLIIRHVRMRNYLLSFYLLLITWILCRCRIKVGHVFIVIKDVVLILFLLFTLAFIFLTDPNNLNHSDAYNIRKHHLEIDLNLKEFILVCMLRIFLNLLKHRLSSK